MDSRNSLYNAPAKKVSDKLVIFFFLTTPTPPPWPSHRRELDFGPFRVRFGPFRVRLGSVSGPFRGVGWGRAEGKRISKFSVTFRTVPGWAKLQFLSHFPGFSGGRISYSLKGNYDPKGKLYSAIFCWYATFAHLSPRRDKQFENLRHGRAELPHRSSVAQSLPASGAY